MLQSIAMCAPFVQTQLVVALLLPCSECIFTFMHPIPSIEASRASAHHHCVPARLKRPPLTHASRVLPCYVFRFLVVYDRWIQDLHAAPTQ